MFLPGDVAENALTGTVLGSGPSLFHSVALPSRKLTWKYAVPCTSRMPQGMAEKVGDSGVSGGTTTFTRRAPSGVQARADNGDDSDSRGDGSDFEPPPHPHTPRQNKARPYFARMWSPSRQRRGCDGGNPESTGQLPWGSRRLSIARQGPAPRSSGDRPGPVARTSTRPSIAALRK